MKDCLDEYVDSGIPEPGKECVLYDRECIGCMECEICDLDPKKICDNCGKCLDFRDDAVIEITGIFNSDEE